MWRVSQSVGASLRGVFVIGLFLGLLAVVGTACGNGKQVPTPGPTPSDQELQALTRTVVTAFAEAVKEEDFTKFFELYPVASRTGNRAGYDQNNVPAFLSMTRSTSLGPQVWTRSTMARRRPRAAGARTTF